MNPHNYQQVRSFRCSKCQDLLAFMGSKRHRIVKLLNAFRGGGSSYIRIGEFVQYFGGYW